MKFVDKEFLLNKVNRNGVYIRIMGCYKIFQKIHVVKKDSMSQALWRFDSIELKEVTKVLQLCGS